MTPYYERDGVTIYVGDCIELLPSLRADVVITDPPYNAGKNYGPGTNDRQEWLDWCAWFDARLDLMLAAAPDVLAFMSQTAWKKYARLGQREVDWTLVWSKPLSLAVCAMPFMPHWEAIAYWGTTRKKGGNFWGSDVITCNVVKRRYNHPTEKPEPLMRELLAKFPRAATVLDPFCGSGTTLRAAQDLGMRAIGLELREDYADMAIRRLSQTVLSL